ncbi:MAG TPA: hypothetical protein DIC30_10790, partial [Oceanospirillales bacterium]|nr:hypothetical protein [Oceanospirillales bacterium]
MSWLTLQDLSGSYINAGLLSGNAVNFAGLKTVQNGLLIDGKIKGTIQALKINDIEETKLGVFPIVGTLTLGKEEFIQLGTIEANKIDINRNDFHNEGIIYSDKLNANTETVFTNSGVIGAQTVDITTAVFINNELSTVSATDTKITNADVINSGKLISTTFDITAQPESESSFINTSTGILVQNSSYKDSGDGSQVLVSLGNASLTGFDSFTNSGLIEADGLLSIKNIKSFTNSEDDLTDLDNAARIVSKTGIELKNIDILTNEAVLVSNALAVDAYSINNSGIIGAGEASINIIQGDVKTGKLTNSGKIYQSDLVATQATRDLLATSQSEFNIATTDLDNLATAAIEIKKGNISLNSGDLNNSGLISEIKDDDSNTNLQLTGIKNLENRNDISVSTDVNIADGGSVKNLGKDSYLNVNSLTVMGEKGQLTSFSNDGSIVAGRDIRLTAEVFSNNKDAKIFSENLELTSQKNISNSGVLQGQKNVSLVAKDNIKNDHGATIYAEKLTITSDKAINNSGLLQGERLIDITANSLSNKVSGEVSLIGEETDDELRITTNNSIDNSGKVASKNSLTLNTNSLTNSGRVVALKTANLDINVLDNSDLIYGENLNVGNAGQQVTESNTRVRALSSSSQTGLVASKTLTLYTQGLMKDVYQANSLIVKTNNDLKLMGSVIADESFDINAKSLNIDSSSNINIGKSSEKSTWAIQNKVENNGNVNSKSALNVTSSSFENNNSIIVDDDISIHSSNIKNNARASISSEKNIRISGITNSNTDRASDLTNNGTLVSNLGLDISASTIINNGSMTAKGDSDWRFGTFTNSASQRVSVDGVWRMGTAGDQVGNINNSGKLYAKSFDIKANGSLNNNVSGQIVAYAGDFNYAGSLGNSNIDNEGGLFIRERADITAKSLTNTGNIEIFGKDTEGKIVGSSSLINLSGDLKNGISNGNIQNNGTLKSGHSLEVSANKFVNQAVIDEGSATKQYEGISSYQFIHDSRGGKTDRLTHLLGYVVGEYQTSIASTIEVNGDLILKGNEFTNLGSSVNVTNNFDIGGTNAQNSSKTNIGTTVGLKWVRTSNGNGKKRLGWQLQEDYVSSDTTVKEAVIEQILSGVSKSGDNYIWKNIFLDSKDSVATITNQEENFSFVNPTGVGVIKAGNIIGTVKEEGGSSTELEEPTVNVNLEGKGDEDTVQSASTQNANNEGDVKTAENTKADAETKGSFINGADDGVVNIVHREPTATISLLSFIIPGLSFDALNAASVAGDKTPEELAAQTALQAQLNGLDNDKQNNSKAIKGQTNSYNAQAPSLFDLDADILARIIADTEYELSPEYIFDKVDPDRSLDAEHKFFLDPYQEAQAVSQAALQQTGTAFFSPDWSTSADQRKGLYDNTLEYLGTQQNVTLGKALTPMQVKQLEQPMIWYVSMNIGGQNQLVPTVYLPEATLDQITTPSAGTLIADNIDLDVSNFKNTGNIKVANSARIQADVITNQRNVMTFGDDRNYGAIAGTGGNISAGDLALISRTDINNNGGSLTTKDSLLLDAQGDINLKALELNQRLQNGKNVSESTDYLLSQLNAGGDATFKAGGDINSQAAQAKIGG